MELIAGFVGSYLKLTTAENRKLEAEIAEFPREEREEIMDLMTGWKEEGLEQGLLQGLATVLEVKFGSDPALLERVQSIADVEKLRSLLQVAKNARSAEEVWQQLD